MRWWLPRALADDARLAGMDVLRYPSSRDPGGINIAVLECRAFSVRAPVERQTWRVSFNAYGVRALCDFPDVRLEFDRTAFAPDPRITSLRSER